MKIFVSICSYRDPLLHFTLESLIDSKSERTDVTYSIFEQTKYDDSLEALYPQLVAREDVIYKRIDPEFAEGVGWARKINSLNITDEDFYYQIDSHMIFDKNWDRILVNDYLAAIEKAKSNKIVITSNCKNFDLIDGTPVLDHNMVVATRTRFYQFDKNMWLYAHGEHHPSNKEVIPCPHIYAGNMFTNADWLNEVGINPKIYFHGEEQMAMLSSFANGYNVFHGSQINCYHYIGSNNHPTKQEINPVVAPEVIERRKQISDIEFRSFLNSLDDSMLETFRVYSGVDYINRKIEKRSITKQITPSIENDWEIPDHCCPDR